MSNLHTLPPQARADDGLNIKKMILEQKSALVLLLLVSVVSVLANISVPYLIGIAIDAAAVSLSAVDFNILLLILAVVLSAATLQLSNFLAARLSGLVVMRVREKIFRRILTASVEFIDSQSHGDIMTRITTDAEAVGTGLLQGISQIFGGVVTIIATIVMMLVINIPTALLVIVLTPVSLVAARLLSYFSHKLFLRQSEARSKLGASAEETISAVRMLQLYSGKEKAVDDFDAASKSLSAATLNAQFSAAVVNPLTRFINALVYAAVTLFGAYLIIQGEITEGILSTFLIYANQYFKPFNELSIMLQDLQSASASSKRLNSFAEGARYENESGIGLDRPRGEIAFDKVNFSYSPEKPLIEGLSLHVYSGCHVAIVGPTGCGKTTLINLLMRFYEPTGGEILLDGTPISGIKLSDVRGSYGMVLQDNYLFSGTIRENIAFGRPGADFDEITAACKKAFCHKFIMQLPNGYDTIITPSSESLSAGQKQLLCIARMLLSEPEIFILDEATANIDTRTEMLIQSAFNEISKGRTSWIVAHRLSTIVNADMILVMKDGAIVESGKHSDLLKKHGFYYELYNAAYA